MDVLHYRKDITHNETITTINSSIATMSTNGTASVGEEGSPLEDNSNSKRRRIAFSCLACRRRKLKCDRIYPSCSRCQKGGHPDACTYDSAAMELGLHQSSGDKPRGIGDPFSGEADLTKTIPRLPSVARSFAADEEAELPSRPPPENATSKLYAQEERIRQLENRIIGLENSIHGARPQWQGMAAGPNFMKYDVKKASDERDAAMKETMIFRGKSFKTQFYGASHYSSYLSHVCARYQIPCLDCCH